MPTAMVMTQHDGRLAMCQGNRLRVEGARMAARREYLTEPEILALIRAEHAPYHAEVRAHMARTDATGERLLDGAQASIYTATMLIGDDKLGIRGALPEIRERLASLEARDAEKAERLLRMEKNQQRILRRLGKWLLKDDNGAYSYPKITAAGAGAVAFGTWCANHASVWWVWVKRIGLSVGGGK